MAEVTQKRSSAIGETIRTVVYAVLIALVVRTFLYEPFSIPSGSMIPNLLIGDYLFVSKFSYGYSRYSFPVGLDLFDGRILGGGPERGDIAVFRKPTNDQEDYIKRIVGLPGDTLQVRDGVLVINGEAVPRELVGEYVDPMGMRAPARLYRETLPNGVSYEVIDYGDGQYLDDTLVYVVPDGHYFAMGDNRDNSTDSRVLSEVGYIPAANLIGRAEFLFFSIEDVRSWWQVWRLPFAIRYSRLFKGLG
jgi:signal peptidase I